MAKKVMYICEDKDCGETFMVEQGKRQHFCPKCRLERIKEGARRGGSAGKVKHETIEP